MLGLPAGQLSREPTPLVALCSPRRPPPAHLAVLTPDQSRGYLTGVRNLRFCCTLQ